MVRPRMIGLLVAALVLASSPGKSQDLPFPPAQAKICVASAGGRTIVDKKQVAEYLLLKYAFNIVAAPEPTDPRLKNLDPGRRVLADPRICVDNAKCSKSDAANQQSARASGATLLAGLAVGYAPPTPPVSPDVYILGANEENAVECLQTSGKPIEAPGALFTAPDKSKSAFRIRGKIDDLFVDRAQVKAFEATSQAVLSIGEDETAKKRSETLQGVVAYRVDTGLLKENGQRLELIPYVQASRNVVKTRPESTAKPSASKAFNVGAMASAFIVVPNQSDPFGHVVNLRPNVLVDDFDDSRILSLNLQYVPIRNAVVNDFILFRSGDTELFWFKPVLDFRLDTGHYLDKGNGPKAEERRNFIRAGGQIGFALLSDILGPPMTLTSTYTRLQALSGDKDVGYFSTGLSFTLDPYKYFSVLANYSNGTRQDTARREQLWTVGLGVRF